jgi:hypothetical protein
VIDERSLLQVALVLESKDCVPRLRGLLASERIDRIIDAAGRDGLTDDALERFGTPTAMRLRPSAR